MKKILSLILAMLTIVGALAISVSAESINDFTCYREDTVTVKFSFTEEYQGVKSGAVDFSYNSDAFDLVGAEFNSKDMFIKDVNTTAMKGVFACSSEKVLTGDIFTLKLKSKATAEYDTYPVTASFKLVTGAGEEILVPFETNIIVEEYIEIDDPTTPDDFNAVVADITNGSSEENFTNIKDALDKYSRLTTDEKAQVEEEYAQLLTLVDDYNQSVDSTNEAAEDATNTAFSVIVNIFAFLSELVEALGSYIWG